MAKASGGIDLQAYNKASQEATNYLQFDSQTGLTVGQEDLDSKVVISGEGVKLYGEDGKVGTEIKSGEAVFGAEDTNRLTLTGDGIALTDLNGSEVLTTGIAGNAEQATIREIVGSSKFKLKYKPNVGSRITWTVITHTGGTHTQYTFYFTQGVPNHWGSGNLGTVYYDGDKTFTGFLENNTNTLTYTSTFTPLYVTFGTRTGAEIIANQDVQYAQGEYSMTFGKELIAEHFQIVMGQANDVDENGDYAFILGDGVLNADPAVNPVRSNAMAVDWNGNVRLKGDAYAGCNSDSTGGNKLVSASTLTGSGTKANMASSTSLSNLAELTLPDKGVYILVGLARFPSNSNGRRGLCWGVSATGYYDHSLVVVPPVSGAITRIQSVALCTATSDNYKVYLNAYHTAGSGTQLDVDYYWRYIKLA